MARATGIRAAAVAVSAGLYCLALPPVGWSGLAWLALVPLLAVLRGARLAARLGWVAAFSLGVAWGTGTWLPHALANYFAQPAWVGWLGLLAIGGWMATPYTLLFAALYGRLARRGAWSPFAVAAAWAATELLRARLLNGDPWYLGNSPWATFGYALSDRLALAQLASVTGVYGLSFLLVAANQALAGLWAARRGEAPARRAAARGAGAVALLVAGCWIAGAVSLRGAPAAGGPTVAIVQADLDAAARWGPGGAVQTLEAYLRGTRQALVQGDPRLVFWPEAALTFFPEEQPLYLRAIGAVTRPRGVEIVTGAPRANGPEGPPYTNSVYLLAPDGAVAARYDKQYLVPFIERFPAGVDLLRRRFGRLKEFSPGAPTPPLPTLAGPAGILVCNEAMLPQFAAERVRQGARYLVNPSNESWIRDRGYAEHQFAIVRLRAVEQRLPLVRVSDQGPSAVVDAWGRLVAHSEPGRAAVLLAALPAAPGGSLYARWGDTFGLACAAAAALAWLRSGRRRAVAGVVPAGEQEGEPGHE